MTKNITLHDALRESVSDLAATCDIKAPFTAQALVDGAVRLSRYQEEGVALSPEVYICNNLSTVLSLIPNSSYVPIGRLPPSNDFMATILKKCAPLAQWGWHIYAEMKESHVTYGLFRGGFGVFAISVDETLFSDSEATDSPPVIRLFRQSRECIEIRASTGRFLNIFLSQARKTTYEPRKALNDLAATICEKVPIGSSETVTTVVKKALSNGLAASHGTIIAVVKKNILPEFLADATEMKAPLDFGELVEGIKNNPGEAWREGELTSYSRLLQGMLSCDGIVVFSRKAQVLAYNCFIQTAPASSDQIRGGARDRAFLTLAECVPKQLKAAFLLSQDGWTDLKR